MKKFYIFLFIIPLVFNSCETDDDNENNNNISGSILGTWELQSRELTEDLIYIDPVNGTEIIQETIEDNTITDSLFITFRYDNTYEQIIYQNFNDTLQGNYWKNDNILSLEQYGYDTEVFDYTITLLNDNQLYFQIENKIIDEYIENDTTFVVKGTGYLELTKSTDKRLVDDVISKNKSNSFRNSFSLFGRNKPSNK